MLSCQVTSEASAPMVLVGQVSAQAVDRPLHPHDAGFAGMQNARVVG
jgi:hypothetical protein